MLARAGDAPVTAPLRAVTDAVDHIAETHDLARRITVTADDEVGELAEAVQRHARSADRVARGARRLRHRPAPARRRRLARAAHADHVAAHEPRGPHRRTARRRSIPKPARGSWPTCSIRPRSSARSSPTSSNSRAATSSRSASKTYASTKSQPPPSRCPPPPPRRRLRAAQLAGRDRWGPRPAGTRHRQPPRERRQTLPSRPGRRGHRRRRGVAVRDHGPGIAAVDRATHLRPLLPRLDVRGTPGNRARPRDRASGHRGARRSVHVLHPESGGAEFRLALPVRPLEQWTSIDALAGDDGRAP